MGEWHRAVAHIESVMTIVMVLHWGLPLAAWAWIRLRRSRKPGASVLFGKLLLWSWLLFMLGTVAYFFTGAWYSENGNPPDDVFAVDLVLGVYVSIYLALFLTTRPAAQAAFDQAKPFAIFTASALAITVAVLLVHFVISPPRADLAPDDDSYAAMDADAMDKLTYRPWHVQADALVIEVWPGDSQLTLPQDIRFVEAGQTLGQRAIAIRIEVISRSGPSVLLQPGENSVPFEASAGDVVTLSIVPKVTGPVHLAVPLKLEPAQKVPAAN